MYDVGIPFNQELNLQTYKKENRNCIFVEDSFKPYGIYSLRTLIDLSPPHIKLEDSTH